MRKREMTKNEATSSNRETLETIILSINEQHEEWKKFLTSLATEQVHKPVDGSWSALDAFVHITSWKENGLRVANALFDANAPDPAHRMGPAGYLHIYVDKFNDEVIRDHKGWTLTQVIEWSDSVNADLVESLRKLPFNRTLGGISRVGAQWWYWMPAFVHARGHRNQVMRKLLEMGE